MYINSVEVLINPNGSKLYRFSFLKRNEKTPMGEVRGEILRDIEAWNAICKRSFSFKSNKLGKVL